MVSFVCNTRHDVMRFLVLNPKDNGRGTVHGRKKFERKLGGELFRTKRFYSRSCLSALFHVLRKLGQGFQCKLKPMITET